MGMEHYIKIKDLGGTNGAFLARDRQMADRLVVIKQLADGTQGLEELNASLRLRHPHIIRFLESFFFNGTLYVVMAYERGGDLEELFRYLMECRKNPTTHTLLLWFVQLLEAVAYCHDHHVIHRDLKPSNILVSESTKLLRLGDFGSAKMLSASDVTSTFVGSPLWISPEVLLGTPYSYAADMWSLGCVFYEMATLRKPFAAASFAHLVQLITQGHIQPLPTTTAPEVRRIIHAMLRLAPAERISAAEALEMARAALTDVESRRGAPTSHQQSTQEPPSPASNAASPAPVRQQPTPQQQQHEVKSAAPPRRSPPEPMPAVDPAAYASTASTPLCAPVRTSPAAPSLPPPPLPSSAFAAAAARVAPRGASSSDSSACGTPERAAVVQMAPASSTPLPGSATDATPPESPASSPAEGIAAAEEGKTPVAACTKRRSPSESATSVSDCSRSNSPPTSPLPVAPQTGTAAAPPPAVMEPERLESAPQQVLITFATDGFARPAPRRARPPRAAPVSTLKAAAIRPAEQRRAIVPSAAASPATAAPTFVRLNTADNFAARRAAVVSRKATTGQARRSRSSEATEGRQEPLSAVKATPLAPVPKPPVAAQEPERRRSRDDMSTGEKWLDERMRELSAMGNYLHNHRMGDDKVLETYDARRNNEYMQQKAAAGAATPLVLAVPHAPRRRGLGVRETQAEQRQKNLLIVSPPASPPYAARNRPGVTANVSPFRRQISYGRQNSYCRQVSNSRQPSSPGSPPDQRRGSLASSFNGRQASNARPAPPVTEEAHRRLEEERVAARERRETERQRMKALIQEQRAATRKQKRSGRKKSAGDSLEIDIVMPDQQHYTNHAVASADR